jgi:hypothetical protein
MKSRVSRGHICVAVAVILDLSLYCHPASSQALSLSSAPVAPGGIATLSLSLSSPAGQEPASLEWAFTYPSTTIASIVAVAGSSGMTAGKTVSCAGSAGYIKCILSGINSQIITNGAVAMVTVTVTSNFSGGAIGISGATGASSSGTGLALTGGGGTLTVAGGGGGSGTATFLTSDSAPQGNWKGKFGAEGYTVIGDNTSLPPNIGFSTAGNWGYVWAPSTGDIRALQKATSATDRVAACWYSNSAFTVFLNFADQSTHQVAIYLLDWDNSGRSEQVNVLGANNTMLDTRTVSNFGQGEYLIWNITGAVTIQFVPLSGNAVLSGIFLGGGRPPAPRCPGVFRAGVWYLDWNCDDQWDSVDTTSIPTFGAAGDLPVLSDWNGDGRLKIGVFRSGVWYVDWNGNYQWDSTDAAHVLVFGQPGDVPVIGDWNGDGRLKIGVFRNGLWFVDWNGNNQWDATDAAHVFSFGQSGDVPVTGDWARNGSLNVGVFRNGLWYVDWNGNYQWDSSDAAHTLSFGSQGAAPVMADWSGNGTLKIGVFLNGVWYPDWSGTGFFGAADAPYVFSFGQTGDMPVTGNWNLASAQSAVNPALSAASPLAQVESRPEIQREIQRVQTDMHKIQQQFATK